MTRAGARACRDQSVVADAVLRADRERHDDPAMRRIGEHRSMRSRRCARHRSIVERDAERIAQPAAGRSMPRVTYPVARMLRARSAASASRAPKFALPCGRFRRTVSDQRWPACKRRRRRVIDIQPRQLHDAWKVTQSRIVRFDFEQKARALRTDARAGRERIPRLRCCGLLVGDRQLRLQAAFRHARRRSRSRTANAQRPAKRKRHAPATTPASADAEARAGTARTNRSTPATRPAAASTTRPTQSQPDTPHARAPHKVSRRAHRTTG